MKPASLCDGSAPRYSQEVYSIWGVPKIQILWMATLMEAAIAELQAETRCPSNGSVVTITPGR
ncbi:hypothetical protein ACQ4M4_17750 [Leptolyngbya sp. AN02str]